MWCKAWSSHISACIEILGSPVTGIRYGQSSHSGVTRVVDGSVLAREEGKQYTRRQVLLLGES